MSFNYEYEKRFNKLITEFNQHINSQVPIEINRMFYNWSSESLEFLVKDPRIQTKILEEIAKLVNISEFEKSFRYSRIHEKLIEHMNTSNEIFKYYLGSIYDNTIINNTNTNSEILEKLSTILKNKNISDDSFIVQELCEHSNTSLKTLKKYLNSNSSILYTHIIIALRKDLSTDIINELITFNDFDIFRCLSINNNLNKEQKIKIDSKIGHFRLIYGYDSFDDYIENIKEERAQNGEKTSILAKK